MKGNRLFRSVVRQFEQVIHGTVKHMAHALGRGSFYFSPGESKDAGVAGKEMQNPDGADLVIERYGNTSSS
jgi:hypothetical protein